MAVQRVSNVFSDSRTMNHKSRNSSQDSHLGFSKKGRSPRRYKRALLGLSHATEGRRLFHRMTVEENLRVTWDFRKPIGSFRAAADLAYERFPALAKRRHCPNKWLRSRRASRTMAVSCDAARWFARAPLQIWPPIRRCPWPISGPDTANLNRQGK